MCQSLMAHERSVPKSTDRLKISLLPFRMLNFLIDHTLGELQEDSFLVLLESFFFYSLFFLKNIFCLLTTIGCISGKDCPHILYVTSSICCFGEAKREKKSRRKRETFQGRVSKGPGTNSELLGFYSENGFIYREYNSITSNIWCL